jgi:hypothetical protein
MNLNDDVVYRCLRFGPLCQLHPGRSRGPVRHHDNLHCLLDHDEQMRCAGPSNSTKSADGGCTIVRWLSSPSNSIAPSRSMQQRPSLSRALHAYRSIDKLNRAPADEREAGRLDPRDVTALDDLGDAFVGKGQCQCAIHDYEELVAIRTNPRGGASGDSFQGCKTRCARKKATTCRSNSTWKTARSKPSASAQI